MSFVPLDSGPIYFETTLSDSHWPIEPWNAISNLIFLAVALYWIFTIHREHAKIPRNFRILISLLLIGWIGGTIYHGTRSGDIWYYMDMLPIYLLAFLVNLLAWQKITSWKWGILISLAVLPLIVKMHEKRSEFRLDSSRLLRFGFRDHPASWYLGSAHSTQKFLRIFNSDFYFRTGSLFPAKRFSPGDLFSSWHTFSLATLAAESRFI